MNEVRTLPLWRGLLNELIAEGIEHGKIYDAERFEEALSCDRHTREFGLSVHSIRVELEKLGYYLQGHTVRDGKLVVLPPERNVTVARSFERKNQKNRCRAIALLGATKTELLPQKLRPYHTKMLMRLQIRQLLDARSKRIHKFLQKNAPKMLEIGA